MKSRAMQVRRPQAHLGAGRAPLRLTSLLVAIAGLPGVPAHAAMHDAETCRRIKSEHDSLGTSGIREMKARGPEWAKTNLTKDRMEQIRRFIALEEDMRFRCPLGKARPELEAAENEAGSTTALQPGEQAPAAKAPPAAKGAAKSKARVNAQATDTPVRKKPAAAEAAAKDAEEGSAEPGAETARKKPR